MNTPEPFTFSCPTTDRAVTIRADSSTTAQKQVREAFARKYGGAAAPRTMVLKGGGILGRPVNIH